MNKTLQLNKTVNSTHILHNFKIAQSHMDRAYELISYLDKIKTNLKNNSNHTYTENIKQE